MEKETIIKALECCTRGRKGDDIPCPECPYNECNIVGGTSERQTSGTCQSWLMKDALALIKELTEECENYKSIAEYQQNCNMDRGFKIKRLTEENDKLRKAKVVYETVDYCADDLAKALEENERLKNICNSYALQYGTARDKEVFLRKEREDTVRKFADRLKKECLVDSGYEVLQIGTIDRIAKEILNKTEEEKK